MREKGVENLKWRKILQRRNRFVSEVLVKIKQREIRNQRVVARGLRKDRGQLWVRGQLVYCAMKWFGVGLLNKAHVKNKNKAKKNNKLF